MLRGKRLNKAEHEYPKVRFARLSLGLGRCKFSKRTNELNEILFLFKDTRTLTTRPAKKLLTLTT